LIVGWLAGALGGWAQLLAPPRIEWQRSFGGGDHDSVTCIRQNGFRLGLHALLNKTCVPEYSTNLTDWTPFLTNVVTAYQTEITDPGATNSPARFYRARTEP
jgi:hypothetical protein